MKKYIVEESELQCSVGSLKSKITVTSQDVSFIEEKKIATQKDFVGRTNIKSFGFCSILRGSCTPKTSKWNMCDEDYLIDETPTLLKTSKCTCSIGGEILTVNTGKNDFVSKDESSKEEKLTEDPIPNKQKELNIEQKFNQNSQEKELGTVYNNLNTLPKEAYQIYDGKVFTKSEWQDFMKTLPWWKKIF